jgi:hypothetical protein
MIIIREGGEKISREIEKKRMRCESGERYYY